MSRRESAHKITIAELCRRLRRVYGPVVLPEPGPVLDELIATLLSQNTTDTNSGAAFEQLARRFPTWDAVLQAEGYLTRVSPPGPDGGVDILAGSGPLGFGEPRMCVQVKSSSSPSDVTVLRGLQGILQNFRAEQGLLVSWGGFKSSVLQEARQSFFQIRLWDSGDLLKAIFKNCDKFSDQLQAELPLKRIWALVLEE